MNLSENAKHVLKQRYLKGNETPEDRFYAVAEHVASAESYRQDQAYYTEQFYKMMEGLEFLPNTPCIANAGRKNGQLNACFVLPVEDSLTTPRDSGIMDTARAAALIHQTGGGTGFDFSRLRPMGSPVASSNGVASGPVSFMGMYNAVTETIKQGGIRRGANMGILHIDHPDIKDFILAKASDQTALTNFNISVAVTDGFMGRVRDGESRARELWSLIYNSAWQYGDPGLFFIDAANRDNMLGRDYPIRATNPCGEIPMPDNDACNLGSINLAALVSGRSFDMERFEQLVRLGIRFLDDVVTVNKVPVPQVEAFTKKTRRLGLGVMGWADFLNEMEIPYDSEAALSWANTLAQTMRSVAEHTSRLLAEEKGPYPLSDGHPQRNVALLCIAPTGSISTIANCSPGIEPDYAEDYVRKVAIGELRERKKHAGKPYFRTAHDIDPVWHVRHQATWQRHIDNGVSKTVNMRRESTPEDVAAIYQLAWSQGCKGITVYRDGSRDLQVYNAAKCIEGACEVEPGDHGSTSSHLAA